MNKVSKLLLILSLTLILLLSACSKSDEPDIKLELDTSSLKLDNDSRSEFITVTIVRTDNVLEDRYFDLVFPQNLTMIYATDVDGNRIDSITTKALKGKDSRDTQQFKIYALKGEASIAIYEFEMQIVWNNTIMNEKEIRVEVN